MSGKREENRQTNSFSMVRELMITVRSVRIKRKRKLGLNNAKEVFHAD